MTNRAILLFLFWTLSLFGETPTIVGDKVEKSRIHFLAGELDIDGDNVIAYKSGTVIYQDRYMRADTIIYNQKTQEIEFFGNVSIVENGLYFFVGDYARLKINGDATIRKMFLYHKPRHIWIYANESNASKERYSLKDTFLSSCRSENPDWGFYIKEGYYDKREETFELYNTILYAKNIPVFYIPYINFSISNKRKSGLLTPESGISSSEGFFYAQPIYIVPNYWSDIEITPQVRTNRGNGIYATYRFVDSPYSTGSITAGYFLEYSNYYHDWNLAHQKHYGLEFLYKRDSLFRNLDDALLIDITYLNDIEYLSLKAPNSRNLDITNLIESKLNYYLKYGNSSFGIYNRYTIDTDSEHNGDYSNDRTLQVLPNLQYHYGLQSLFSHLLYSFDYNYKNYVRKVGTTANQHEINIPITLYWNFLDDYLKFIITEHLYGSYIEFDNTDRYRDTKNYYFRYYHQIGLFTDISRKFRNGLFHSIDFGADLLIPDREKKRGFYTPISQDSDCKPGEPCEFQIKEKIDSSLELKFSQYLYNRNGREIFSHKLREPIAVADGKIEKLEYLYNEFLWKIFPSLSLYNSLDYKFTNGKVMRSSATFKYEKDRDSFDISYFLKRDEEEEKLESISSSFTTAIGSRYSLFANYSYDITDKAVRSWGLGYEMKKRCWNYKLEYREDIVPISQTEGTDSRKNSMVYFMIELFPLGGFDYQINQL
ncbi:MAG TPA: LPS-assembly protein LptD [Campylobacterales bacterium]|nr:LPS-assembly protein LptD [Campylobacterales bacterium]